MQDVSERGSSGIIPPHPHTPRMELEEFVCGGGAAVINVVITFPIHKVIFRQMLHGFRTSKAIHQLRKEGIRNLYRGVMPPLCQKTLSVSLMFGLYDHFQKVMYQEWPHLSPGIVEPTAAMLAGTAEAFLTPFERVQTLLQTKHYHSKFTNTIHAFRSLHPHGVGEYYRGLIPILLRNGPSNILFFELRGRVKDVLPGSLRRTFWGNFVADFISGAIVGGFISTLFYPLNLVKTHMQIVVNEPFQKVVPTFRDVLRERGNWKKMFRGASVNFTRAVISWGVINASYEFLKKLFF